MQAKTPRWMRPLLIVAGLYNLIWGAWAIFFPQAYFLGAGMPPINYPQIWQCVGMIVGVYGIGYLIAAQNPVRHWPIVLVGFLGKLLGPLGFLQNALTGVWPWRMGWVNVTNDLIWLIPFALILHHAWRSENQND
jgi:small multidrug resistance pump